MFRTGKGKVVQGRTSAGLHRVSLGPSRAGAQSSAAAEKSLVW
jgi:hypothetical protein